MRVACLVPYPLGAVPSQRYRVEQWAGVLERQGIRLEFLPFLDRGTYSILYRPGGVALKGLRLVLALRRRLSWLRRSAARFDAVVVHREATCFGIDRVERRLAALTPTVFDFDDAIWLPNVSPPNRAFARLKGSSKVDRILRQVAAVSAGCEFLADHARPLNQTVRVVPTSIDLAAYGPPRGHAGVERLTVGWTGSLTTAPYLADLAPVLRSAAARQPLRFVVYGARLEIPGLELSCVPWSAETEVSVLRTFDVGLKPMPQQDWVRGKCPMKELQYMALGIPVVATRFGTTLESVGEGGGGLLCSGEQDWTDALLALRSPELRARLGEQGRRTVEARYSSTVAAAAFAEVLALARDNFARRRSRAGAA